MTLRSRAVMSPVSLKPLQPSNLPRNALCTAQMLSLSIDFYVRVFVRVFTSPKDVKDAATRLAYVYQSSGCDSFYLQPVGRKVHCPALVLLVHKLQSIQ